MPTHPGVDHALLAPSPSVPDVLLYALVLAGLAALTRFRPSFGIAALTALVPFAFYRQLGPTTLTLPKMALLGVIAGLVLRRSDARVLRAPAAATLLWCGAAVLAATALSIAVAAYRGAAVRETLKSLEYLLAFAAVVVAARADGDERAPRLAFCGSAIVVSLSALAQEAGGAPSVLLLDGHAVARIAGVLEGPNQLAGYLGISLCMVAAYLVSRPRAVLESIALTLGTFVLLLTLSRAGTLAALGGILLTVLVSYPKSARGALLAAGGGAFAGCLALGAAGYAATHSLREALLLLARFSSTADATEPGSVGNRSEVWHAALTLWRQHPFLGVGAGNFELELDRAGYPGIRTHANSLYLQALVEGGVPLLAATLALIWSSLARFARGPFGEPLIAGALGAGAALAAHQIVDLLTFFPKVGELWWIVLGLGAARLDAVRVPLRG